MSSELKLPDSLADFYAHALGLEHEYKHRWLDLWQTLEAHHNHEAAAIFAKVEKMRADNIVMINARCETIELPRVAPWDYYWHQYVNIESAIIDTAHYMISARESIELVVLKFEAACEYYQDIQTQSPDKEVKQAAENMIGMLKTEMRTIQNWKQQYSNTTALPDLDPPNQPE